MSETPPTASERLSKILTRVRTRGPGEVTASLRDQVRSAIGSQGMLEFLTRDTDGEDCAETPELSFRSANFADASAYARQIGTDSPATFRARLTDATSCYLVEAGGRIAHASWVTTAGAWTEELRTVVTPPPDSAYVYESFTDPALRGRGIYPLALGCICAELSARGLGTVWIGVESTNLASVRAIAKAGFRPAFSIAFRKTWGRLQVEPARGPLADLAGELLGVRPRV